MATVSTEAFSKWNINYGDLLVDQGKYLESVEAYDAAFEATDVNKLKIEAIYKKIHTKFPKRKEAEFALYQAGMLAKDMQSKEALGLLDKYLKEYRKGKFYFQVKFTRDRLKKELVVKTPVEISQRIPIKVIKNVTKKPPITPKKKIQKSLDKMVKIRVALHKKIKKITFSGDLIVDNKRYSQVKCYYENKKIIFNNKAYSKLIINSNSPIKMDSKKYKYSGKMKLIAKGRGIRVINIVDIENYIYGVVTSESISSWHIEALKSQAIASRTYAYYQASVRKNWDYDVLDNTGDQVYKGLSGKHKNGVKATDATRGEILTYKDKPILAQYTANSGWKSASSKEIFGVKKHYLYGHEDPFSKKMPSGKWKKQMSLKEIQKDLNKRGILIGELYSIQSAKVGPSGRILKVKFIGSKGEKTIKTYSSLRRIVGLMDVLTTIEREGDIFYFNGGGFGHGVGYSQWGGQAMAKDGYTYKEILKYYYKDVNFTLLF